MTNKGAKRDPFSSSCLLNKLHFISANTFTFTVTIHKHPKLPTGSSTYCLHCISLANYHFGRDEMWFAYLFGICAETHG